MKTPFYSRFLFTALCLSGSLFLSSCETEPEPTPDPVADPGNPNNVVSKGPFEHGVFITNEGSFSGSGSLSYYNRTTKNLRKDLFETVNSRPLGSIVQSMAVHNDKAYI